MSVRKGQDWGRSGELGAGAIVVDSDAAARSLVEAARRRGEALPVLGLTGGDLRRTLGGTHDEAALRRGPVTTATVDVGSVLLDGRQFWFVAHLVAHRRGWRGRAVAVMNAEWMGRWDVAPRSHPGDGVFDVLDGRLGLRDRIEARRRLPLGTHLPHPDIEQRRVPAWQTTLEPATPVFLDGVPMGPVSSVSVRVEADALTVAV